MTACEQCGGVTDRIRIVHGEDRVHLERECVGCGAARPSVPIVGEEELGAIGEESDGRC